MSRQSTLPIRVGLVGASPSGGWGIEAHLPALLRLPEFEVTAVATTREVTAQQTADAFGIPKAFASADELVAHPDVDLVVVSVKVPSHDAIIRSALAARKHVLSEWPLGRNLAEAAKLADLAATAGVVHAVGLQGVHSAGVRFVRDLIASGRIGEVHSVRAVAASATGRSKVTESYAWMATDSAAGANLLSITGGHMIAALAETVGPLTQVSAVIANLIGHATIIETGDTIPVRTPSQVALLGTLANGAVVSLTLGGGHPSFSIEFIGSDGALTITPAQPGAAGGSVNIGDWAVSAAPAYDGPIENLLVPKRYLVVPPEVPSGRPFNVANLYREIAQAITEQRQAHPSFDTAVQYHRVLAAIETASQTGVRQRIQPIQSATKRP